MTLEFYLVASLAVTLTGISKCGFAGGLGVLAVPLMSLFQTPQVALAIMMPILLLMDVANIWNYRASWSRQIVWSLLPGAFLGLSLGAMTFQWMNPSLLKVAIGAMALLFVAHFVFSKTRSAAGRQTNSVAVFGLGALSGFSSFVAHAGGPPVKGYLLQQKLEKSEFVGTNSIYFFILNFLKTISYLALGQFTAQTLQTSAALLPFLVLGVFLGFLLHRIVNQRVFTNIAYVFLGFAGVKLLWDGLSALG